MELGLGRVRARARARVNPHLMFDMVLSHVCETLLYSVVQEASDGILARRDACRLEFMKPSLSEEVLCSSAANGVLSGL